MGFVLPPSRKATGRQAVLVFENLELWSGGAEEPEKSTVARRHGELIDLPVIELDKHFWQPGLVPPSRDKWVEVQQDLAS